MSIIALITDSRKKEKMLKERRENEESVIKNAKNDERNCPTKDNHSS